MSYRDLQDIGIKDEAEAVAEIERLRDALRFYATAEPIELYRDDEIAEFQRRAKEALGIQ